MPTTADKKAVHSCFHRVGVNSDFGEISRVVGRNHRLFSESARKI
ncbi:Uncharacterized protein dnm_099590 [Desulfonema magnum]|uniref:Uncharacterized protein n=1 Tax=Desulfonema magnum TaxID=45655 RepID=A0A975GU91_9BACT|nr:Uncharacterized protein dnm_099590 [Desulfonema magnum]